MRYFNPKTIVVLASIAILIYVAVINLKTGREYANMPETVDFNFHVKPILVQKCYLCHGPDPSTRKGGLRLDTEEGATQLLKSGNYAVNRDHPDVSALLSRIEHKDPDMVMPPPDSKMLLTETEVGILTKWIRQGAEWKPHWAFIQPDSTVLKRVKKVSGNPIDFFIKEQLNANGLKPVGEADKFSLLRRAAYLLTGLPPTVEAIDQFIADKSPDAYEKMIDRYLQSNAFGERWARHWMDLSRYAETRGHEFDFPITDAWRYRDYLVRAFNEDIGYDQLLKEQLAGDLLQEPRYNSITGANESHLGTIFLAMTEGVQGPVDIRKDEADRIDNMIDVTSKTFQSLTLSCSRCHDHKFDPIPTTDYYSMYGIMEGSRFSPVAAERGKEDENNVQALQQSRQNLRKSIAAVWLANRNNAGNAQPFQAVLYTRQPDTAPTYTMMGDFRKSGLDNWTVNGLAFYNTLGNPVFDTANNKLLYLEEGKASSTVNGLGVFGVLRSPNFIVTDDAVLVRARGNDGTIRVVINNFQLISDPIYGGLARGVNKEWENIVIDLSAWKGHNAYIEVMPGYFSNHQYQLPEDAFIEVKYALSFSGKTPAAVPTPPTDVNNLVQAIQRWQTNQCYEQDVQLLNAAIQKTVLPKERLGISGSDIPAGLQRRDTVFYTAVYDGNAINSPVFIRGDHQQLSAEPVPRRFFSVLNKAETVFQSSGSGRLELAEAMLSPDNPLTARVMVNRIWQHLFGKGIVETVDNFGLQGKLPTHPALLDYLALRFQQENWSVKKMIRLMVLSETFRRSTTASESALKKDPSNIYLARFPLLRIEAEAIRDGMLMASGRLDTTMYGPPVPVYLTSFMNGRGKPGKSGPLDGNGRRSVYQEVRRNFLDPMMLAFDRPTPFSTFGNRNVTNVPAQSLFFMNDPFVLQQAEIMAKKLLSSNSETVEDRIQLAYKSTFSRPATEAETEAGIRFLQQLASTRQANDTDIMNNMELWKDYCHSLFNLKEFIFLI